MGISLSHCLIPELESVGLGKYLSYLRKMPANLQKEIRSDKRLWPTDEKEPSGSATLRGVYMYVYIHMNIYKHKYIYVYAHMHVFPYMRPNLHAFVSTHVALFTSCYSRAAIAPVAAVDARRTTKWKCQAELLQGLRGNMADGSKASQLQRSSILHDFVNVAVPSTILTKLQDTAWGVHPGS